MRLCRLKACGSNVTKDKKSEIQLKKEKNMNCRNTETRRRIVEEYDVKPVAHIKLLAGQIKHSDAEAVIRDEYYIFTAKNKGNGKTEII
ncbi:MAG: hypothetical protein MRZ25_00010 [Ruminococcus sp.]|nr:hypothetical protein [Ruminococcus sp.]